jgi:hypothetical protein
VRAGDRRFGNSCRSHGPPPAELGGDDVLRGSPERAVRVLETTHAMFVRRRIAARYSSGFRWTSQVKDRYDLAVYVPEKERAMKYTRLAAAVFCLTLAGPFVYAQTPPPSPPPAGSTTSGKQTTTTKPKNAQQQKMADCNAEAKTEKLTGQKRKDFMKSCLSSDPETAKKTLTAQQEKMKKCNADATAKSLKGAARKKFMSDCLKG